MKLVTSLATVQYQFSTTAEKCNGGKHGGGRGRVDGRGNWGEEGEMQGNHATSLNQKSVGGGSGESGMKGTRGGR